MICWRDGFWADRDYSRTMVPKFAYLVLLPRKGRSPPDYPLIAPGLNTAHAATDGPTPPAIAKLHHLPPARF